VAWDIQNNSSELVIKFRVQANRNIIKEITNYPNPFTSQTTFCITHSRPFEPLQVYLRIFSASGQFIKTIDKAINTSTYRSCDIEWDGTDEFGRKVKPGLYFYNIQIETVDGFKSSKTKNLLLL
jgi:flagellar hook assembly protein FlgD